MHRPHILKHRQHERLYATLMYTSVGICSFNESGMPSLIDIPTCVYRQHFLLIIHGYVEYQTRRDSMMDHGLRSRHVVKLGSNSVFGSSRAAAEKMISSPCAWFTAKCRALTVCVSDFVHSNMGANPYSMRQLRHIERSAQYIPARQLHPTNHFGDTSAGVQTSLPSAAFKLWA